MSANCFPKFPYLPAELRRMIWSFCIPGRRVYEMHTAMGEHHGHILGGANYDRGNGGFVAEALSGRIPVISHVCREAREVVLKRHVYVTAGEGQLDDDGVPRPEWDCWNECLPVRLRKGFDVVHLHWTQSYYHPIYLPPTPNPLPYYHWLAKHAAAASFNAELLHNPGGGRSMVSIDPEDAKYFIPHKLYYGVLEIVEIHMTHYEAAHAGVFGRLGEEPIQLVDPRDTAAVAAFRDVWRRHRSPSEEPDVAELFSYAVDSAEAYRAEVEQWLRELETVWIWYKCKELRVPDATLDRIWPDPNRPTGRPIRLLFPFPNGRRQRNPTFPSENTAVLNWEHPWVREQLEQMPRFEPALMFRHCPHMCGLSSKPRPTQRLVETEREVAGEGMRATEPATEGRADGGGRRRRTRWGP